MEKTAADMPLATMRILLFFPHMVTPGGALNYCLHLADLLLKRGATVAVVTMQADRKAISIPQELEVISLDGPLTSNMGYWLLFPYWQLKIHRVIRSWKPDLFIPQVFPSNWWGWIAKQSHRDIPLIWIDHEPSAFIHSRAWINAIRPFWKRWIAHVLRPILAKIGISLFQCTDKVVANSRFTSQMTAKVYGREADGIAYPGIDLSLFKPDDPPKKEQMLISVARLTRFKRIDFLLRVFHVILKNRPHLRLVICGDGEEKETLSRLTDKLGITANVIFTGKIGENALTDLYRKSLAFISGSVEEPFGIAPVEAIASGTPVIAHNSGGPPEFVTPDCGLLIDSLSEERWAYEIERYLSRIETDISYYNNIASCAFRFDWSKSLEPILTILREVMSANDSRKDHLSNKI